MKRPCTRILAMATLALAAGHCGGSTTGGTAAGAGTPGDAADARSPGDARSQGDDADFSGDDSTTPEDSGLCEGTRAPGAPLPAPAEHRAQAATCAPSGPVSSLSDAGGVSCTSAADCNGDAATLNPLSCIEGNCTYDECLADSDCPGGSLCLCGTDSGGGLIRHNNACVPADCHVDSDCGAGGYCSPSRGYCGEVSGYYCHGARDACVDPATDCLCPGAPAANSCVYAPQVGYWVCGQSVCMG
jgi:hypothetical protein